MKGTFFSRPLEFQITIEGECWAQGHALKGELKIKNHGAQTLPSSDLGVQLALGDFKKVKVKSEAAFSGPQEQRWPQGSQVAAGAELKLPFHFQLDLNAPVTDKNASLYLRYGQFSTGQLAHLQLSILPRPIFQKIAEIADIFLRFKSKEVKFSKGKVAFKLIPPDSREFLGLEEMLLELESGPENILASYSFKQKSLGVEAGGGMKIDKKLKSLQQTWPVKEIFLGPDFPNQERIIAWLKQALGEVKSPSA